MARCRIAVPRVAPRFKPPGRFPANSVVVKRMLDMLSPLQRALLISAVALAPRGPQSAHVQHAFDQCKIEHIRYLAVRGG